jgi:hypothetical protein
MGSIVGSPKVNGPTPPPPAAHPAVLGSAQTALAAATTKKGGAVADGMGFNNTIQTSPQGLKPPSTAKSTLLG